MRVFPRSNPSKKLLRLFCLKTMYWSPAGEPPEAAESKPVKRTQASIVRFVGFCEGASGICTQLFVPSKLNAGPTIPGAAAVAVPTNIPWLVPTSVLAFPSPAHQPTRPSGAGEHEAAARSCLAVPRHKQSAISPSRAQNLPATVLTWKLRALTTSQGEAWYLSILSRVETVASRSCTDKHSP